MKVLYLNGVDRGRDDTTTRQLTEAEPSMELSRATSPPDAFARIRESGDYDALVTSPAVARSETLALIVSLRRDKVPVAIVPVVTESQQEFATAAIAAGADDVLMQLGGMLLNAPETLARVFESLGRPARGPRRLRVMYAGDDELVWTLLGQLPFVEPIRAATQPDSDDPIRHPTAPKSGFGCDAMVIDSLEDLDQQARLISAVRRREPDLPTLVLTPPILSSDDLQELGLRPGEHIPKTGLYRRPLVTAMERLNADLHAEPSERRGLNGAAAPSTSLPAAAEEGPGPRAAEPPVEAGAPPPARVEAEPAAPAAAPPAPAPPDDATAKRLAAEAVDQARRQWDDARVALESRLAEAQAAAQAAATRVTEHETAMTAVRAELDDERKRHEAEVAELTAVRGHLESALEATRAELRESGERHVAERGTLQAAVEKLEGQVRSLEEARAVERSRWEKAAGSLEGRLRSAAAAAARAEFEATVEAGQNDLRRAEKQHAEERAQWASARTELAERLTKLEGIDVTRARLARELEAAQEALHTARAALDAARTETDSARAALEQLRRERDEDVARHEDAAAQRDEARAALDAERSAAEMLRGERDDARAELDAARVAREAADAGREAARAAADEARRDLEALRQERHGDRSAFEALQAERDEARQALAAAEAGRDEARGEAAGLRAERNEARREIDGLRRELDETRAAVERVQQDHAQASDELGGVRQELSNARAEIEALRGERDGTAAELSARRADNEAVWEQLDAARQERDEAWAERDRLGAELEGAREALRRASEERAAGQAAWSEERAAWDAERSAFETERRGFDALVRDAERAATAARDELRASLDTTRAELDAEREASEAARAALERVREELQTALDEARREADEARDELRRAAEVHAARLDEARAATDAARGDLRAAQTHLDESGKWHASQQAAWDTARQELEGRLATLEQEHATARRSLEARLRDAEERVQALSAQVTGHPAALEAERRRAAETHRRFVRRGLFGHCLMTRAGRLLECNDAFARIFGYASAEDVLRQHADRPFAPLAGREALDARLMGDGHAHGVESCLDRADGQPVRVLESASALSDPARGELVERVLIDLSEFSVLEERLQRARRLERVGQLTAEMGADIEAALTAAAAAGGRARQALPAGDARRSDLDAALAAADRAAGLVRQLVAFGRRQQRAAEPLDLNVVLDRARAMLGQLVGPHVALEVRPGQAEPVSAGEDDITQLLTALAVQARDLLPLGGAVRVSTGVAAPRTDDTGLHARHVVLSVAAIGYGVGAPQLTDTLDAMAGRCAGSITVRHETGRSAAFDVSFARCLPSASGAAR